MGVPSVKSNKKCCIDTRNYDDIADSSSFLYSRTKVHFSGGIGQDSVWKMQTYRDHAILTTLPCLSQETQIDLDDSTFLLPFPPPTFALLNRRGQGIFLSPLREQSSRMFEFVFKMFAVGSASLPDGGMGQVPEQIAADLPGGMSLREK